MKVLHIGTYINDGAGLGMFRLHESLLGLGVDSRILTLAETSVDPSISSFLPPRGRRPRRIRDAPASLLHRLRLHDSPFYRVLRTLPKCRTYGSYVSSPFSRVDVMSHPWVKEADIVHLHWISGFVDWPSFFRRIRKPVVWTLRDENPALGFWHFRSDMPDPMPDWLRKEDDWLRTEKATIVQGTNNLSLVSLSSEEDAYFARTECFRGRNHRVIPNSINDAIFVRSGGDSIRRELGIPSDAKVFSFVAQALADPRKGFQDLDRALARLNEPSIVVLCAGRGPLPRTSAPVRYVSLGLVTDPKRLAAVFSASNLFVTPSRAETFGKTTTEALACGVPVISYPNAGAKDIVGPEDGALAEDFTPLALERAIRKGLARSFSPVELRNRALTRFSRGKVAASYLDLYDSLTHTSTSDDGHEPQYRMHT